MISAVETANGLYGAWRLARLDPNGLSYFDTSTNGFWRSFYAAVLVAPLLIILLGVRFASGDVTAPLWRFAAIESIAYVISWTAFPFLMVGISQLVDRSANYIRYIVAYNWATVWQNLLFVPFAVLMDLGIISGQAQGTLTLVVLAVVLGYVWAVTRIALGVTATVAAGLVILDLALSIFINVIAQSMINAV